MARGDVRKPLLSGLVDPVPQLSSVYTPKRRRFRRVKSAPLADLVSPDVIGECSVQQSESVFRNLHPSFRMVALYLVVYLGLSTICFYLVRDQISGKKTNGFLDSLYLCIVTMTTVGYGDLVPNSVTTKLIACAFVFTGMALVGHILTKAADYLVEKQEILLVKALHMRRKVGPSDIMNELETHKASYKCLTAFIILVVLIFVGTIFLVKVEKLDIVDAFYCVCSTITTLGYGDQSFKTTAGRIFAVFWILTSTICLAQFILYAAELNTENRQKALVKWVLHRKITKLDLEAADLDDDGVVGAPEFIIYKLKEMGKISQEDIFLVMKEFEDLDVDQSGTLSNSDIALAQ